MPHQRAPSGASSRVRQRLRDELRRYLIVCAYLFVCFAAIMLYRRAVLGGAGSALLPLGAAATKALIMGKFLLLGEAARIGKRVAARSLRHRIAVRVPMLLVVLMILVLVEELLVGVVHGQGIAATLADFDRRLPELLASALLMMLILVPVVAVTEVDAVLGPGVLRRLLAGRPASGDDGEVARLDVAPGPGHDRSRGGSP